MTQYTYFQQAAGQALPAPAVEITYGLERILAALQVHPLGPYPAVASRKRAAFCPTLTRGSAQQHRALLAALRMLLAIRGTNHAPAPWQLCSCSPRQLLACRGSHHPC